MVIFIGCSYDYFHCSFINSNANVISKNNTVGNKSIDIVTMIDNRHGITKKALSTLFLILQNKFKPHIITLSIQTL